MMMDIKSFAKAFEEEKHELYKAELVKEREELDAIKKTVNDPIAKGE